MKKPMVFIVLVILVALFTLPPLVYAQAPDTQPIIINPLADGRIEVMPSNLPFDVRNLRAVGDPTTPASSYDEASVLIHEAVSTANKIAATNVEIARVDNLGRALHERIKAHNAQWPNGCVYTEQNPRACDGWIKEGKEQNEELRKLKTEYEYLKGVRGTLRSHLSIIQSRLRLGAFLDKLTPWQKTVVACSKMENSEQAELCLALKVHGSDVRNWPIAGLGNSVLRSSPTSPHMVKTNPSEHLRLEETKKQGHF